LTTVSGSSVSDRACGTGESFADLAEATMIASQATTGVVELPTVDRGRPALRKADRSGTDRRSVTVTEVGTTTSLVRTAPSAETSSRFALRWGYVRPNELHNAAMHGRGAMTRICVDDHAGPGERGVVIRLAGSFDCLSVLDLRCELLTLVQLAGVDVVVNLAGVSFIDCAALGLLVEAWSCADIHGHGLSVTDPRTPIVGRILDILAPTLPFSIQP
jgi:anti-anti-sigma factor